MLLRVERARLAGVCCAVLSVAMFSCFTLVSRAGLTSSALALPDLAALRFGIGGTLLMPVLLRKRLHGVTWRDAASLALFGGLGFATLAYAGFSLAPAAHGAVLLHGALTPLTYLLVRATGGRPAQRPAAIALIALGVGLMALDSVARATPRQLFGDILLLCASASWSLYGVRARALGLAPAHAAALVAVLSMVAFVPIYLLVRGASLLAVAPRELALQALVQGVLIGSVSTFVYTRAVAVLGAAETSLFTAAVPCITTLAAVFWLGESPGGAAWCGVGVVTLGTWLAPRAPARATHATDL